MDSWKRDWRSAYGVPICGPLSLLLGPPIRARRGTEYQQQNFCSITRHRIYHPWGPQQQTFILGSTTAKESWDFLNAMLENRGFANINHLWNEFKSLKTLVAKLVKYIV